MNTEKRYYITKSGVIIVLDSRNYTQKNNGSMNSSILFDFQDTVFKNKINKAKCSVLTFSAPNSLYIINENNNILSLTINNVTTTYGILYGNYNSKNFISTLLGILPVGFNITLNTINNKLTMTYTSNFTINSSSTIQEIMGFSLGTSYTSINNSLTLPYTVNFNGLANFNIHFRNVKTRNIDSYTKTVSSIIQSISLEAGNPQIRYNKQNNYSFDLSEEMEFILIDLKDDLDNFINLNNKNWNMTLLIEEIEEFDILKSKNDFTTIVENGYTPFDYF